MTQDSRDQFIHLMRLAWDLRMAGIGVSVKLLHGQEPFLEISRAVGPLRVMASQQYNEWRFTWGRGRDSSISALSEDVVFRILQLARNDEELTRGSFR